MSPEEYCADKVARAGSSLYYGLLFLQPEKRRAAAVVHAFVREVRDVVDECSDPVLARTKLAWWRQQIATVYGGTPQHPVARALQEVAKIYRLPEERFQEIMDGVEMDLTESRYPDFQALALYCHRVAGVVNQLCAEIFGYEDQRTLSCVHDLGLAIQLARIIRDVGKDARRNRIYLPIDEMSKFHVQPADVLHRRHTDGFTKLTEFEIDRAVGHFTRAEAELPVVDRRAQRAGLVLAAIYRTLLDEIRADGCRVLDRRTSLTPVRKLWIAWHIRVMA